MAFVSLLSLVTKKFSFHPFLEVRNLAPNKLRKETMLRSSVDKPLHRNKCDFGPSGSQIKGIRDAGSTADFRILFEILKFNNLI